MKNVKKETIIRTACLVLALINQLLTAAGHSPLPIDDSQLTQLLSTGLTIGTSLAAWWYNNSFTRAAIAADRYKDEAKKEAAHYES